MPTHKQSNAPHDSFIIQALKGKGICSFARFKKLVWASIELNVSLNGQLARSYSSRMRAISQQLESKPALARQIVEKLENGIKVQTLLNLKYSAIVQDDGGEAFLGYWPEFSSLFLSTGVENRESTLRIVKNHLRVTKTALTPEAIVKTLDSLEQSQSESMAEMIVKFRQDDELMKTLDKEVEERRHEKQRRAALAKALRKNRLRALQNSRPGSVKEFTKYWPKVAEIAMVSSSDSFEHLKRMGVDALHCRGVKSPTRQNLCNLLEVGENCTDESRDLWFRKLTKDAQVVDRRRRDLVIQMQGLETWKSNVMRDEALRQEFGQSFQEKFGQALRSNSGAYSEYLDATYYRFFGGER